MGHSAVLRTLLCTRLGCSSPSALRAPLFGTPQVRLTFSNKLSILRPYGAELLKREEGSWGSEATFELGPLAFEGDKFGFQTSNIFDDLPSLACWENNEPPSKRPPAAPKPAKSPPPPPFYLSSPPPAEAVAEEAAEEDEEEYDDGEAAEEAVPAAEAASDPTPAAEAAGPLEVETSSYSVPGAAAVTPAPNAMAAFVPPASRAAGAADEGGSLLPAVLVFVAIVVMVSIGAGAFLFMRSVQRQAAQRELKGQFGEAALRARERRGFSPEQLDEEAPAIQVCLFATLYLVNSSYVSLLVDWYPCFSPKKLDEEAPAIQVCLFATLYFVRSSCVSLLVDWYPCFSPAQLDGEAPAIQVCLFATLYLPCLCTATKVAAGAFLPVPRMFNWWWIGIHEGSRYPLCFIGG